MVPSTIELYDCITGELDRIVSIAVEQNYYNANKLDIFASLTTDNKLLFGALTMR
jgi:hypothetical protein